MKALLINPESQSIEQIEIQSQDEIAGIIGFDTITSDEIGPDGDRLYFDEECFLRGTSGRFQIDTVIPVSGKGIIVGSADEGETLTDALKREILEEVSINIEIGGLVRLLERIFHDRKKRVQYHYVIADYWGWMISGDLRPESDVSDARFVTLSQLKNMGTDHLVEETVRMAIGMRTSRVKR